MYLQREAYALCLSFPIGQVGVFVLMLTFCGVVKLPRIHMKTSWELSLEFWEHWLSWFPHEEQVCPVMARMTGLELKLGTMILMSDTCSSLLGVSWGHRTSKPGGNISDSEMF